MPAFRYSPSPCEPVREGVLWGVKENGTPDAESNPPPRPPKWEGVGTKKPGPLVPSSVGAPRPWFWGGGTLAFN